VPESVPGQDVGATAEDDRGHPQCVDHGPDGGSQALGLVGAHGRRRGACESLTRLDSPSDDEFFTGLDGKLLGQVRRVRAATRRGIRGSVTLTGGRFDGPLPGSTFGRLVNVGLEAFVHAAPAELPDGLRVNVVSPGWVRETLAAVGEDGGVPADVLARVYVDAVEGAMTGITLTAR
jgi:NAD(P)-dependent dehydrogenase (short-subunit alcohol dehydrogenase family)